MDSTLPHIKDSSNAVFKAVIHLIYFELFRNEEFCILFKIHFQTAVRKIQI